MQICQSMSVKKPLEIMLLRAACLIHTFVAARETTATGLVEKNSTKRRKT